MQPRSKYLVEVRYIEEDEWYLSASGVPIKNDRTYLIDRERPAIVENYGPTPERPGVYTAETLDGKTYFALVKERFSVPTFHDRFFEEVPVDLRKVIEYRSTITDE